jgi:small subunit ribosomal protein S17
MAEKRGKRRKEVGIVIKDKMDKSIVVRIDKMVKVPKYGKYVRRETKLAVHDENNEAKVGDKVEISESRCLSKTKNWRLVRILEKSVST